jgi:predicted CXXCH cytochrome family protein
MKRLRQIGLGFILVLSILLFTCCSPSGRTVLSFFFDGVPERDSTISTGLGDEIELKDSTLLNRDGLPDAASPVLLHYPYGERTCIACHDEHSLGEMVEPQPGLCYLCHQDLSDLYAVLHGPVAGGYCTSCHDPHESTNEKLLRYTGDDLCFHCHKEESVIANEIHEGLDGMSCTDCHNAHGGEDRYIFQ